MSTTSVLVVTFESLTNIHTRPSRSHAQSRFVPGTAVTPSKLVNTRLGNAGTTVQLADSSGAASGMTSFRNGPISGRAVNPNACAWKLIWELLAMGLGI